MKITSKQEIRKSIISKTGNNLAEKITQIIHIHEKNPNFKGNISFKKWCNYSRKYGHSIAECRQKQQDNQNKPQNYREPNKYTKKDQKLPNKYVQRNKNSRKPLPDRYKVRKPQSLYRIIFRGRSPDIRNSQNYSQNRYSRSKSQNNQYRRSHYSRTT